MCIIVYKPKGKLLKKEVYENCFNNNKDGAGFIVREKSGELTMQKGFFTFKDFWDAFVGQQWKQSIIHFRITTHGTTSIENCHPFWVKEGELAFAHNGVINAVDCKSDYSLSDTWHFNTRILKHLHEKMGREFIYDPVLQEMITDYIGYSKLAFIEESGKVLLFNESKGETDNGVWFSNNSYKYSWETRKRKEEQERKKKKQGTLLTADEAIAALERMRSNQDKNLLPPPQDTQIIPIRSGPPLSSVLRVNDFVEVIEPWKDVRTLSLGKVVSIFGDQTIEAKIYDKAWPSGFKLRRLPIHVIMKYSSAIDPMTGKEFDDSEVSANDYYNQGSMH